MTEWTKVNRKDQNIRMDQSRPKWSEVDQN